MGKIRLLPEALASQVAAGEVVERPASVVKELVENSIDAGSSNIEVKVQRGGIALIRVTDNGCGMNRDDALMCLERNATSKIRTKDDLAAILTLGFRGEAIPSIASVSKFRLVTREPDSLTGTEITINGGKVISVKDCGEPAGTQVEARSLFYNLPARRKFLRTENTEFSHIEQVVKTQAIAHENIRFSLVRNDRLSFQLPATSNLRERIGGLVGIDLASRLLEVAPHEHKDIRVRGFIGPPGMGRSDRRQQLSFLNGRPVEAAIITRALREGYHTALMKGQYPVTFLFIETEPTAVDVNVHPAKREVRFHDGFGVQDAIIGAVQQTLRAQMVRPVSGVGLTGTKREVPTPDAVQDDLIPTSEQRSLRKDWSDMNQTVEERHASPKVEEKLFTAQERERAETDKNREDPVNETLPLDGETPESKPEPNPFDGAQQMKASDYRLLGVIGKLYVLLESAEGLVLMDQHAAHERVLFEEMKRRMETEVVPSQNLLSPIMVDLTPRDFDLIEKNLDVINKLGLSAEPFGGTTLKIDSLPNFLKSDDPERFIQELIDEIRASSDRMSKLRLGEDMIATTVCRHAVKANDLLHDRELQKLLEDLLECDMPYCCPHGRPTLIQISFSELERKFGRRT
ncbi:MAG: DNA mismatch repair protein MutL [Verrucomicrobiales bacterium]|nr:DNA mismatch repair protein MutL [Verrucomicrobiales bacterium]|tara:strand:- start:44116 stop:46005 length:1890 start_codon:yes stop_codon:yes gene_type:complete